MSDDLDDIKSIIAELRDDPIPDQQAVEIQTEEQTIEFEVKQNQQTTEQKPTTELVDEFEFEQPRSLPVEQIEDSKEVIDPLGYLDPKVELSKFEQIADEVIGEWRRDRAELGSVIEICRDYIREGGAERIHYETIVKALEVKTDSSASAVKLLEAKAKLLSALKPSGRVSISNYQGEHKDNLTDILAQPNNNDP